MFLLLCLLKNVEIVIIDNIRRGILKQKVLKALANPPRIFYVPYTIAMINFFCWFMIFVVCMVIFLIFTGNIPSWFPLVFLGGLSFTHTIFGIFSRKDSQISQLIFSSFYLLRKRIPRRLVS